MLMELLCSLMDSASASGVFILCSLECDAVLMVHLMFFGM